jgi:hypothetical protein
MKRSKHSLSHYKLLTCDMGKLVPVGCYEVLPGDTVQQATSLLVRVSPLVAPVMHPVTVRVHHWFVPHRLVWNDWEKFITGGKDGLGEGAVYPFSTYANGIAAGTIEDYLGVKPGVPNTAVGLLPRYSYNMIYNEFYRDQDLQEEVHLGTATVQQCGWEKDYFTTARPWPQKGPDVTIPLGLTAPVVPDGLGQVTFTTDDNLLGNQRLQLSAGSQNVMTTNTTAADTGLRWDDPALIADLTNATAANINDVRRAFALQRYQEARAQYGSRYTEYLRYLGIRPSDARLQRPEYLGGGKATISFSEVIKTGSGENPAEAIGTLKGHGISAMRSRRFRRFIEEHGIVISLLSVRPRSMYTEGLNRMFSRRTKEDYYQRELEHIGQQEIFNREVWLSDDATGGADVFGYQDRYAEYRHVPSHVCAEFRDTLNYWHLGRSFASQPVLNASFIECDPSKRIHAEQTAHALWIMVSHSIQARRMVTKSTIGRII